MSETTNSSEETPGPGSTAFSAILVCSIIIGIFTDAPFFWTVGIGFVIASVIGAVIGSENAKKLKENEKKALASAE